MRIAKAAVVVLATVVAGCSGASSLQSPAAPTSSSAPSGVTLQSFAGAWGTSALSSSTALPSACTSLDYKLSPSSDGRSGVVTFKGTCAGITAEGTGRGTLDGSVLSWSAEGTGSKAGVSCAFSFANSTATLEGAAVRVNYRGTVCGVPVSGSELLQRQ